ncbi:MAG: hypothetical protein CMJ14_04080 [Pelagibacterales bacterium]|nr:hypothetical protein [Pelagibacterales bacterium]|tara:strand:+ start:1644 stop:4091 length:2448 start_codon:yes stop_codon:yes gene_type:complete
MNSKQSSKSIPAGLSVRIFLAQILILWEKLAKTIFYTLFLLILFLCLSLLNFFSMIAYTFHILTLCTFVLGFICILFFTLKNFKWPSKIDSARRIEIDNNATHRPISTIFDTPGINKDSNLWDIHYSNMLEYSTSLKKLKLRSVFMKLDPLCLRLPLLILFSFIYFSNQSVWVDRVHAAILPHADISDIGVQGTFTGWLTPPEYTKKQPILLMDSDEAISSPSGSVLSARVFGGEGNITLHMDDKIEDFIKIDDENASIESIIDKDTDISVFQNNNVLFNKYIKSIPDKIPTVEFIENPKSTIKGILDINYVFGDDYSVIKLFAEISLKNKLEIKTQDQIKFNIPFENSDEIQTFGRYYHDLTEHIWAGLPVNIVLNVEDFVGQKGKSDVVEILLPEKQFNNLIALSVINQRKSLAWGKDTPHNVGQILEEISESPEFENKLNIAKEWLLEAANILNKDKNAKTLNSNNYNFVIDLLWKTALFIESGQLAVAENELRRAQEDLREALSQGNEGTEIDDMVSNLDTALKKYLEELENPMDIDAPQLSESDNPGDRGGENGAQANDKENLEEKLEEIADLAASGSLDEAQEQLENMQDMTEAMDRDALGEALGEQEGAETPMAMQQISEMMQEQEALMEDSFEQSLNSAQADQKTPGSGPVNAGKEQEMLRKQLEDVMHEISESDNPMPEELGRAERAMKQAERELQRGRPDRAQTAQGRAIEELKKAAEKIDKMHSGDGPSQMAGDSGNNNSRDQRDPLGRVPPGQGTSPGGDIGLPSQQNVTKAKEIVKELYKKAESSQEGSVERKYVDSLLDWY